MLWQQAGASGNPTRPQLGLSGPHAYAAAGNMTRPHLSAAAGNPTQPQLGFGGANRTCPQLGDVMSLFAQAGTAGATPPTRPQLPCEVSTEAAARLGPSAGPMPAFEELVRELWCTGWEAVTEGQPSSVCATSDAHVVLECILARGLDLSITRAKYKCLALHSDHSPWNIGRMQQPDFFARLVPDEELRSSLSRCHLQLAWRRGTVLLKKLSANVVLLDGRPVPPQQELPVPHGGHMGLCGQDSLTAFLVFRVLVRPPSPAPAPSPAWGPEPGGWWYAGFAENRLVCVMACGLDVERLLALEARSIGLKPDETTTVGRLHQPGLFERLLGEEAGQHYLCCVSRGHLELRPVALHGSLQTRSRFEVKNLSSNPVQLAGAGGAVCKLFLGDSAELALGGLLEFLGGAADGSGTAVPYLRLALQRRELACGVPAAAPMQAVVGLTSPTHGHAWGGGPPFWLVLGGSAVRQDFPEDERYLEGRADGLIVGRAHQQALHGSAFDVALRQYLSRDHFRVEAGREGWQMVPLSSNPLWRRGRGRSTETGVGQTPLRLADGDEIVLFTGAHDCTADGPGSIGSLFWIFREGTGVQVPWLAGAQQALPLQLCQDAGARGAVARPRSKSPRRCYFGDSTAVG